MSGLVREVIDEYLNGHGELIITEAERAELDLALACALVEQESGGRNVFGCDAGDVGDTPPYCGQPVTRKRVRALRDGGSYSHGMNGVGLTQITWWEFVERAEELGGAHLPIAQCRVGFEMLKSYLDRYPYLEALGAYNAGEINRMSVIDTYAASAAAKHEAWRAFIADEGELKQNGVAPEEHPTVWIYTDEKGWQREWYSGSYVRAKEASTEFATDGSGWQYMKNFAGLVVPGKAWSWPKANDPPRAGGYVARHPTRYTWRADVEEWARYLVDTYDVWCNTYHDHPEGYWRDADSLDVWGSGGRGDPIDLALGDEIFNLLFYYEGRPDIDWIIWRATIYGAWNGWRGEPFGDGSTFTAHRDHLHITYE